MRVDPFKPTVNITPQLAGRKAAPCGVCLHRDRGLIEAMMAEGVWMRQLVSEFGISAKVLSRHETIHATAQPSVDPLSILRMQRWIVEEAMFLAERAIHTHGAGTPLTRNHRMRIEALDTASRVLNNYAKLTNADKYMDPHVTLPRWQQVMAKITVALEDIPGALEALKIALAEEGPSTTILVAKAKAQLSKAASEWDEEKYGPYSEQRERELLVEQIKAAKDAKREADRIKEDEMVKADDLGFYGSQPETSD